MQISGLLGGILAIIFAILIFVFPKMLNYLVAFYFLIFGVLAVIRAIFNV